MKLRYNYTRLNVENYAACKQFYQEVLGFEVSYANDAKRYAELATGDTKITLLDRERLREFIGTKESITYAPHEAKIVLTFAVDDLDAALARLKQHDIPLVNNPWQRLEDGLIQGGSITTCFRDPDGNLIELEQILS
jgi:catechol 2,3-dioxygenase-like lactoylglutathione lyase family enzyme